MQALTQHPILSAFVQYTPVLSRYSRIALYFILAVTGLFFSAVIYAARNGGLGSAMAIVNRPTLARATSRELVAIGIITVIIQLPIAWIYRFIFSKVGPIIPPALGFA